MSEQHNQVSQEGAGESPGESGFVSRTEAAIFLRKLADTIMSTVDGRFMKVTVDVRMERARAALAKVTD